MEDPAFWACGIPSPDLMYPICNFDTGKWEEEKPQGVTDDKDICGEIPQGVSYVVCNYVTGSWQPFTIISSDDFDICGEKPVNMGFSYCNGETAKWEEVGVIHVAPGEDPFLASDFAPNPVLKPEVSPQVEELLGEMIGQDPTQPFAGGKSAEVSDALTAATMADGPPAEEEPSVADLLEEAATGKAPKAPKEEKEIEGLLKDLSIAPETGDFEDGVFAEDIPTPEEENEAEAVDDLLTQAESNP